MFTMKSTDSNHSPLVNESMTLSIQLSGLRQELPYFSKYKMHYISIDPELVVFVRNQTCLNQNFQKHFIVAMFYRNITFLYFKIFLAIMCRIVGLRLESLQIEL